MNMDQDQIAEISIGGDGRLCVYPATATFPYIYREAMEVHWDAAGKFLWSPKRGDWDYARWFAQIVSAAKEQGVLLCLSGKTLWTSVPNDIRAEISGTLL